MKQFCRVVALALAFSAGAFATSSYYTNSNPCDTSVTDPIFHSVKNGACLELTLDPPSGIATGAIGTTTGWGYTITNPSPYWILFSDSQIFALEFSSPLAFCSNLQPSLSFGTCYNDLIVSGPNTPFTSGALAPFASFTQAFDLNTQSGFASFVIVPVVTDSLGNNPMTVQPGLQFFSIILLEYDAFTMDPILDPNFDPASSVCIEAPVNPSPCGVWVNSAINATPEPGTAILVGLALALIVALRLRPQALGDCPELR